MTIQYWARLIVSRWGTFPQRLKLGAGAGHIGRPLKWLTKPQTSFRSPMGRLSVHRRLPVRTQPVVCTGLVILVDWKRPLASHFGHLPAIMEWTARRSFTEGKSPPSPTAGERGERFVP